MAAKNMLDKDFRDIKYMGFSYSTGITGNTNAYFSISIMIGHDDG